MVCEVIRGDCRGDFMVDERLAVMGVMWGLCGGKMAVEQTLSYLWSERIFFVSIRLFKYICIVIDIKVLR